jgi:hypothetical protein
MKKLIAIAMVFALVAGAAFAADLGASVGVKVKLIDASSEKDAIATAGGNKQDASISASAQNDEGTFGGWFKFKLDSNGWPWRASMAKVWWKPIEQFKFTLNYSDEGFFGADDIVAWGFYEGAGDYVANHNNAWYAGGAPEGQATGTTYRSAVYGGFDKRGAIFTINPISGLEINFAVPLLEESGEQGQYGAWGNIEDVYKRIEAQVAYNIDGIGKVAFTFAGYNSDSGMGDGWNDGVYNPGKLFGYFNLTAVENLGVVVGIGLPFYQFEDRDNFSQFGMDATVGAKYTMGAFGVKARFVANFASSTSKNGSTTITYYDGVKFIFDLMPYYAVNDNLSINLGIGFGGKGAMSDSEGTDYKNALPVNGGAVAPAWHVYPYVTVKGGPGTFYAGLQFYSKNVDSGDRDSDNNVIIHWEIPIGLSFSF